MDGVPLIVILNDRQVGGDAGSFGLNTFGMELPQAVRPMIRVSLEQSISGALLPENGFISGKENCFGQFERSILRLEYFPLRSNTYQTFNSDLAASIQKGEGSLIFIGFGSRFSDADMGVVVDVIPDSELRKVFDFEFAILRAIIDYK